MNYKHLHYFWMVAQEGSMTRAAERLGVTVQTVSSQIGQLEQDLGHALLAARGRGVELTDAGRIAWQHADDIFRLGLALQSAVQDSAHGGRVRLRVGITDGIPKLLAHRLLSAVLDLPGGVRLVCDEGEYDDLLSDLARHRLDVVLADRTAPAGGNLRLFSTPLGRYDMGMFGTPALAEAWSRDWPNGLQGAPMLLPGAQNLLRARLDQWLTANALRPEIVAEFEDTALLDTFARTGLGIFPAPLVLADDIARVLGAQLLGPVPGVHEQIHAISAERRIQHPGVARLYAAAQADAVRLAGSTDAATA